MHAHQCFETTRPSSTSKASGRREQRGGGSGMPVACKRWRKCSTGSDDRRAQRCWIWVGTQPMTTHVTRSADLEEERGAAAQKTAVDRLSGIMGRAGCACAHLTVTIDDRLMKWRHNCRCHADGQKWRWWRWALGFYCGVFGGHWDLRRKARICAQARLAKY